MYSEQIHEMNPKDGERGSIVIMTAIMMLFLFLMVGLCVDVSRFYMIRAELQNAADAAALTASRELNSGTGGIDDAVTRANAIVNTQGFGKAGVSIASITFAVNLDGPYWAKGTDTTTNAPNIRFVKVTTQAVNSGIFFAGSALGSSYSVSAQATAGMSVGVNGICDFFPAAVALADPSPTPGTLMSLRFTQGTGNSAVLNDKDYIILEVPDITGNGTVETAVLTAGIPNFCKKIGDPIFLTPSSNKNNGPRNSGDGMNTRFDVYQQGYGGQINDSNWQKFPPDSNIQENISVQAYRNRTSVTAPSLAHAPGQDDRRMIIAPIVAPGTYPTYTTNILGWGIFFLRSKSPTSNGNCDPTTGCGSVPVEYVGKANVGNAGGAPATSSNLTLPVLYR